MKMNIQLSMILSLFAVAVIQTSGQPEHAPAKPQSPQSILRIEVVKALYGKDDKKIDITKKLQELIDSRTTINFKLYGPWGGKDLTGFFGDPTPGEQKEIEITYTIDINNEKKEINVKKPDESYKSIYIPDISELNMRLHSAIAENNAGEIEKALKSGANIYSIDHSKERAVSANEKLVKGGHSKLLQKYGYQ